MSNHGTKRDPTLDPDSTILITVEGMWGLWWREASGVQLLMGRLGARVLFFTHCLLYRVPFSSLCCCSKPIRTRDAGATSPGWERTVAVCAEAVTGPREGHTAEPALTLELKPASLLELPYC